MYWKRSGGPQSFGRGVRFGRRIVLVLCAAAAGPSHLAIAQAPGAVTELRSDPVFTGQVEVPAGKKYVRSLPSAAHFTYARIAGSIQASGGQGNDIRVVVLKDLSVVFDSGRRRS